MEFKKKWSSLLTRKYKITAVDPSEFDNFLIRTNLENYGSGDKEVIYFAHKLQTLVITDDRRIKNYCKENNLPVIGTLRILKSGYLHSYFTSKREYIEIIDTISQDLYLSKDLVRWAKDVK